MGVYASQPAGDKEATGRSVGQWLFWLLACWCLMLVPLLYDLCSHSHTWPVVMLAATVGGEGGGPGLVGADGVLLLIFLSIFTYKGWHQTK